MGGTLGIMILLLVGSIPVGAALGLTGLWIATFGTPLPLTRVLGSLSWSTSNSILLTAVPFFVLIGEILLRSGIAARMYHCLAVWTNRIPGGLMHSNIASCTLFSATCGSSVATAATVGTVALRSLEGAGYNERLFLGTLAAGGTLGILIPPSINMVVYGVITNTSIPDLYLAGIIPGLALAMCFSLVTAIACLLRPGWGGTPIRATWRDRWETLPDLAPPILMFLVVVGSIYGGLATPTEAAAAGAVFAILMAVWFRRFSVGMLCEALLGTMRTTGMIFLILLGAYFLNFAMGAVGMIAAIGKSIEAMQIPPHLLILVIIVIYLILGALMDELSMMVATVPIVTPIVVAAGYDPLWFGILLVILLQAGMILPPVGINLFVIQSVRGRGDPADVAIGAVPYVGAMLLMMALLILAPGLALWLPSVAG